MAQRRIFFKKLSDISKYMISPLVVILLTISGYITAFGNLPLAENNPVPVSLEFASLKTPVIDVKSKVLSPMSTREYVVIGDRKFEVMSPWLGHRIEEGGEPQQLDFVMLPLELVLDRRKIYVTAATRDAFVKMAAAASLDHVELLVDSGYRSVAYQKRIYQRKLDEGDNFYDVALGVAPPGYSEHMLGTTLDLVPSKWTFSGTVADQWLLENAAGFSFIQSYPQKSDRGFTWEPWHWKYIGES